MSALRLAGAGDLLISSEEIHAAISDMADYYNQLYGATRAITSLTVLNGAKPFADSLLPMLHPAVTRDSVKVSSMDGAASTGILRFDREPQTDLAGKDVLVIEDLVDTGLTLSRLYRYLLEERQARSVQVAALFEKPSCRKPGTDIPNLRTGIRIADKFVIGFGMDWNERYRELPYLTIAEETRPGVWQPVALQSA